MSVRNSSAESQSEPEIELETRMETNRRRKTRSESKSKRKTRISDKSAEERPIYDFIEYNPPNNKMSTSSKPIKTKPSIIEKEILNETIEESRDELGVPQVKIGPNGDIILDESTLVIENPYLKHAQQLIASKPVIKENHLSSNSQFKRKSSGKKAWNKDETLKFYRALNTVGTDFSIMSRLFPKRDRTQLKLKFKFEERRNPNLVKKALQNPLKFDIDDLEEDMARESIKKVDKKIKIKKKLKKIKKAASFFAKPLLEEDEDDLLVEENSDCQIDNVKVDTLINAELAENVEEEQVVDDIFNFEDGEFDIEYSSLTAKRGILNVLSY